MRVTQWTDDVLDCVIGIGKTNFTIDEMYVYVPYLSGKHPNNNTVREQIRKQLQVLRNHGVLKFLGSGNYELLEALVPKISETQIERFKITLNPPPNEPLYEFGERNHSFSASNIRNRMRDKQIGDAGERAVVNHEKNELFAIGMDHLAEQVEQVSASVGDHLGYDVRSFCGEGYEKWIEVKTTTSSAKTKFHISENQVRRSEQDCDKFWLYRLYDFRPELFTSSLFKISGELRTKLKLEPVVYRASVI